MWNKISGNYLDMKHPMHITANVDAPDLLQNMIEKLAYRHFEIGYGKLKMPKGFRALETSSTEAYVSGHIVFNVSKFERLNIPFITSFIFTCIKGDKDPYHLMWSSSCN
jgi:hypothetical protein